MRVTDPWLTPASIEWKSEVDVEQVCNAMLGELKSLAQLLESSIEPWAPESAEQIREQIVVMKYFQRRLWHHFGRDGLCQEFYRLRGLHEDFDRSTDSEINGQILAIVNSAKQLVDVGKAA